VVRNSSVFHVKNDGNIMRGSSERHQRSGVKNEPRSFVVHWTLGILRHFRAFSSLRVFPAHKQSPRPPQRQ